MEANKPDFQLLNHTADLGMIVRGKDLQDLFVSGAKALVQLMVKPEKLTPMQEVPISVDGQDLTDVFIRWLGEILYLFEGDGLIFHDIMQFKLTDSTWLEAVVFAAPFNPNNDEIIHEIKAVTYHQAYINCTQVGWEARVIFDI